MHSSIEPIEGVYGTLWHTHRDVWRAAGQVDAVGRVENQCVRETPSRLEISFRQYTVSQRPIRDTFLSYGDPGRSQRERAERQGRARGGRLGLARTPGAPGRGSASGSYGYAPRLYQQRTQQRFTALFFNGALQPRNATRMHARGLTHTGRTQTDHSWPGLPQKSVPRPL